MEEINVRCFYFLYNNNNSNRISVILNMKKQIDKIREYFKGLTVTLDNIVLMVKFPDTWILGLSDGLLKDFKCEVRRMQDGVYVVDQFENGYEEIFKCVNTIISVNKEMEAKSVLLKQKAKELSELFLNSSLDELENLEFNFNKKATQKAQKKTTTKKNNEKNTVVLGEEEPSTENVIEVEGGSLLGNLMAMNNEELNAMTK